MPELAVTTSILGPGIDPYRTALGGRNFEYNTGEDPFLGSKLVIPLVLGFQQQGVWANVKHYAARAGISAREY
jgi:beta-glucosidase